MEKKFSETEIEAGENDSLNSVIPLLSQDSEFFKKPTCTSYSNLFSIINNIFTFLKSKFFFRAAKKEIENLTVNSSFKMPIQSVFKEGENKFPSNINLQNEKIKQPAIFRLLYLKLKNKNHKIKKLIKSGIELNHRNFENVN